MSDRAWAMVEVVHHDPAKKEQITELLSDKYGFDEYDWRPRVPSDAPPADKPADFLRFEVDEISLGVFSGPLWTVEGPGLIDELIAIDPTVAFVAEQASYTPYLGEIVMRTQELGLYVHEASDEDGQVFTAHEILGWLEGDYSPEQIERAIGKPWTDAIAAYRKGSAA